MSRPKTILVDLDGVICTEERAFERPPGQRTGEGAQDRKIEHLEAKIVQKNEVIAELMEENVRAKKANGEL